MQLGCCSGFHRDLYDYFWRIDFFCFKFKFIYQCWIHKCIFLIFCVYQCLKVFSLRTTLWPHHLLEKPVSFYFVLLNYKYLSVLKISSEKRGGFVILWIFLIPGLIQDRCINTRQTHFCNQSVWIARHKISRKLQWTQIKQNTKDKNTFMILWKLLWGLEQWFRG